MTAYCFLLFEQQAVNITSSSLWLFAACCYNICQTEQPLAVLAALSVNQPSTHEHTKTIMLVSRYLTVLLFLTIKVNVRRYAPHYLLNDLPVGLTI